MSNTTKLSSVRALPADNTLSSSFKQKDSTVQDARTLTVIKQGAHWLIQSRDLLQSQNLVLVEHDGAIYRLQTTRLGKLILTK